MLSVIPGMAVKLDPRQTNNAARVPSGGARGAAASRRRARPHRARDALPRLIPTGVPGMSAFELAVGDAAGAHTDAEIATYVTRIMASAGE